MTSDLQPMCDLTFGSMLIYHIIICRLVYTGLYCYFITSSSADCLYIIIYIGHITDCLNPIAIGWYRHRLELLHQLVSRSVVLIYYLHIFVAAGYATSPLPSRAPRLRHLSLSLSSHLSGVAGGEDGGYAAVVRFVWHRASRSPHCLRPQPPVHVPDERSGVGGRREPAEVDERRREVTHGRSLPRDQARPRRHQGVHAGPPPPPRLASPPSDRPLAPPSPARPCAAALASSVTALAFFASMLASPRHCLRRHPRRKRLGKRNWEASSASFCRPPAPPPSQPPAALRRRQRRLLPPSCGHRVLIDRSNRRERLPSTPVAAGQTAVCPPSDRRDATGLTAGAPPTAGWLVRPLDHRRSDRQHLPGLIGHMK
uniref:Uncharacterized protein n=1 Tax=Oryza sativa subsp. japonica TaxID=39947 RepID=Q6ZB86_ORYSJ|nr:hypothetical protein [Oryza sativa Japonica Group]